MKGSEPPGVPEWVYSDEPPEDGVDFEKQEELVPGVVTYAGDVTSSGDQDVAPRALRITASALEPNEEALRQCLTTLRVRFEAMPDDPRQKQFFARLDNGVDEDRLGVRERLEQIRAEQIDAEPADDDEAPEEPVTVIVFELEIVAPRSTTYWAAVWTDIPAHHDHAWRSNLRYVRMRVKAGKVDLRGVGRDVPDMYGGGGTGWEDAKQHCVVHAYQRSTYKLTNGWHR